VSTVNRPPLALSPGDLAQLQNYDWPGNVRELQNIIERGVISARDGAVSIDLPKQSVPNSQAMPNSVEEIKVVSSDETRRMQRDGIVAALERSGGKVYGPGGAAELLGVPPTTLAARIRKFGLR
jgi:transcriptional regulator with GAF, ATPase, and Fis domain